MSLLSDLAPPQIVDALFATISYRLEPGGRGTRFPIVMDSLYAGRLDHKDAAAALIELGHIEAGLKALPPERAVWSFTDLRRFDDSLQPVNHVATNLYEYFVACDGQPLLVHLRQVIEHGRLAQRDLAFHSEERRRTVRDAVLPLLIGLVWTVAGCLFFPRRVLVPRGGREGPLLWPFGLLIIAGGLITLLMAVRPGVERWARRHGVFVSIASVLAVLAFLYVTWERAGGP